MTHNVSDAHLFALHTTFVYAHPEACVFSSGYYCGVHGKVLLGQCVQQLLCEMVSGGIRICCV